MAPTPKTIQIFLPGGDPHGIRVAHITNLIAEVIEVPRILLDAFLEMPQSAQVGVYFLIRAAEEEGKPKVYIGQTGELRKRLVSHHNKKGFWERAVVLVSRANSLTTTHTRFLEWHCLQEAKNTERYTVENGNEGSREHTPEALKAECQDIFDTASTLLATLGFPIFAPVVGSGDGPTGNDVLHCTAAGIKGRGRYTTEGFVVLKGSEGRRENVAKFSPANQRFRSRLIDAGIMKEKGDKVVFTRDHLFGSPSMAAIALLGRTSNGWKEWKNEDGVTLDELKRSTPGETE